MPCCPTTLTTERLRLRRYVAGQDAGWYAEMALRNRAHLARYESGNAAMRIASMERGAHGARRIRRNGRGGQGGLSRRLSRATTMSLSARSMSGSAMPTCPAICIGFFCDVDHLRQGYICEAAAATVRALFEDCGAERVGLGATTPTSPASASPRSSACAREGHMRADKRNADGSVTGSLLYGLLRSEFAVQ